MNHVSSAVGFDTFSRTAFDTFSGNLVDTFSRTTFDTYNESNISLQIKVSSMYGLEKQEPDPCRFPWKDRTRQR